MIRAGEADTTVTVSIFSATPNICLFSVHHWVGIQSKAYEEESQLCFQENYKLLISLLVLKARSKAILLS